MRDFFRRTRRRVPACWFLSLWQASPPITGPYAARFSPPFQRYPQLSLQQYVSTDEKLHISLLERRQIYDPSSAHQKVNRIMRDIYYLGDVLRRSSNVRLMDLLYDLQHRHGITITRLKLSPVYRSPKTNLMLASLTEGVRQTQFSHQRHGD